MAFPFSIKYTKQLKHTVNASDMHKVLNHIAGFITNKTGEDINIQDNQLTFKSRFFRMRWNTNIMAPIEKGAFTIISDEAKTILIYEIFMYRLFIIVSIMSVVMATVSQQIWFGVLCFFWLGGMNWIIARSRHRNMLNDIANGIDFPNDEKSTTTTFSIATNNYGRHDFKENNSSVKSQMVLFYITVVCWVISLLTHILALADFDVAEKFPFIWLLHIGIFVVIVSAIFVFRKSLQLQDEQIKSNPLKVFGTLLKGTPYWLIGIGIAGFIYALINFSLFASSQIGTPDIQNGHYVLQEHGQLIKTITETEYHHYKANEVRGFSGHWIAFYGIGMALLYPYGHKRRKSQ